MSEEIGRAWISEGVNQRLTDVGWQIHRHNKSSGKSRGGIVANGLSEYIAKSICNDANQGARSFRYKVVSPSGEIFSLMPPLKTMHDMNR